MQQQEALDILKMGKNVFLTGAAGAGKTYLLNQYIHYLKSNNVSIAITASTGIAATHINGTTIHSWSGIGVKDNLSTQELEKLSINKRIKRNYKNTKVLIIDEISMLHKYQLDMLDVIARHMLNGDKAFGGMQVVLCGDFFQLPPISSHTMAVMEKEFAFDAAAWQTGDFHVCYLHEQYRQHNDPLLDVLNDIRSGTAGEHTKVPLRTRYKKEPLGATKATKLYSRNVNVDAINEQELANLPGQVKTFTMRSAGFSALVDGLKKNCLAAEELKLKIGAEVMFIKNDVLGRYVNGSRGVVIDFDRQAWWPIVKTYDNKIITASPEEWKYEELGVLRAMITQVPLRLAWAITIHKSQGLTLDAAEIDLGDAFEPGMGYVALSRVRSLTGLKLMNLNEMALKVNTKILQNDANFKEHSVAVVRNLHAMSIDAKLQMQQKILAHRFEGLSGITNDIKNKKGKKTRNGGKNSANTDKSPKTPTHMITLQLLNDGNTLAAIAETRELTLSTVISHIEKCQGLKLLNDSQLQLLKNQVPPEAFNTISAAFAASADGKLKEIYDKYAGKYSYADIKIVRACLQIC